MKAVPGIMTFIGLALTALTGVHVAEADEQTPGHISVLMENGVLSDTFRPNLEGMCLEWTPKGGVAELLLFSRNREMQWTLETAFADETHVSMVRGNAPGGLEYWCFEKKNGVWSMTDRADLGFPWPQIISIQFTGLRTFDCMLEKGAADHVEITKETRSSGTLYRQVLKNGVEFRPGGR